MKFRRVVTVMLLGALLGSLTVNASCAGDGEGNGGNGDNGGVADVVSMMEKVPKDTTEFALVDVRALGRDDDLEDIYDDLEDAVEDLLDTIGTDLKNVNGLTQAGNAALLDSSFDIDDVRDELESQGFDQDECRGVEVWESLYGGWVALVENLVILGPQDAVGNCIDVIEGIEGSLWDNRDAQSVIDRLPSGILIGLVIGDTISLTGLEYQDLEASGWSFRKKDKDTLEVTGVLSFDDEEAGADAIDEIESDLEEEGYKNFDFDQDEDFVKVTADIDIEDFLKL